MSSSDYDARERVDLEPAMSFIAGQYVEHGYKLREAMYLAAAELLGLDEDVSGPDGYN